MSELNQLLLKLDYKTNFNEHDFYLSKSKVLDERLKSDIVWFSTGLKMSEFEACKEVAQDLYIKEISND